MEITSVEPEMIFWESLEHSRPLENPSKKVESISINMSSNNMLITHDESRLHTERDVCKGITDNPKMATRKTTVTIKLGNAGFAKPALNVATLEDRTERKAEPTRL